METALLNYTESFPKAPFLTHVIPNCNCIIETNAFNFMLGLLLSQKEDHNMQHIIAYHSRKFSRAEINYEVNNQVPLGFVNTLKTWQRNLDGTLEQLLSISITKT
jgi:hypothetical protein